MSSPPITEALHDLRNGDESARGRLVAAVYDELRDLARAQLRHERSRTLVTTELVHEAYERVLGSDPSYEGRGHFFGAAARAMWNFGLDHRRIVAPRDGWPNPAADAMASGAGRLLDEAVLSPDLPTALADTARNMNRGPRGVASLAPIARNMNRSMLS